jgi:hypothetical protein
MNKVCVCVSFPEQFSTTLVFSGCYSSVVGAYWKGVEGEIGLNRAWNTAYRRWWIRQLNCRMSLSVCCTPICTDAKKMFFDSYISHWRFKIMIGLHFQHVSSKVIKTVDNDGDMMRPYSSHNSKVPFKYGVQVRKPRNLLNSNWVQLANPGGGQQFLKKFVHYINFFPLVLQPPWVLASDFSVLWSFYRR